MPADRVLSRLLGVMVIPVAMALLSPVAAAADQPTPLTPWQEQSVLAALQDPALSVRYAAITWLSDKQARSPALAKAIAAYLHGEAPPEVKASALQALGHMGSAALAVAPEIVPELGDPDYRPRGAAVAALGNMKAAAPALVPRIAALLKSSNPYARGTAADALNALGVAARFAPQIAALLKDSNPDNRNSGAGNLGEIGPAAVPFARQLQHAVTDAYPYVRFTVAASLGRIGQATRLLRQAMPLLKEASAADRGLVLDILAHIGTTAAPFAPQIAPLLKDPDPQDRAKAALLLGTMGPAAAAVIPQLAAALKDPDHDVRAEAGYSLAHMGPAAAAVVPQITALLRDPDPHVRIDAATTLGEMGGMAAAAAPALAALLKDPNPDVRSAASNALSSPGDSPALALSMRLTDLTMGLFPGTSWKIARNAAGEIVSRMGPAAAAVVPQIAALLADPDSNIRADAAEALGNMGSTAAAAAPQLAALLKGPGTTVPDHAAAALIAMGPSAAAAVPQVILLLKNPTGLRDPSWLVRSNAVEVLSAIESTAAIPQIVPLLKDASPTIRASATAALEMLGPGAAPVAPQIAALLGDTDSTVRFVAAYTLGQIGPGAAPFATRLAALLADPNANVRHAAMQALDSITLSGPLQDRSILLHVLDASHVARADAATLLLRAYLYRELDAQDLVLIRWLGARAPTEQPDVTKLGREGAYAALQAFNDTWDATVQLPVLRTDMAEAIAELAGTQAGETEHSALLQGLQDHLAGGFPLQALAVQGVLDRNEWHGRLTRFYWTIGTHLGAWILLIFAYPRWRWVQGFFFWNRWARRFLGLFYVGVLITVVPWLRRRMLAPFRESFLPRRILEQLNERAYFPDSEVLLEMNGRTDPRRLPVKEVLPSIRGQVVIKGQSGLGKTLLLLRLALTSREPVVFLRATECAGGVVNAIQNKVQGQVRDAHYLRSLIHAGALKVLIDGLNEASPDARTRITQFVEEYFKGDFILTTQPISWEPPATARVYVLQPLAPGQIEPFLVKQWASVEDHATLSQAQYQQAVRQYLAGIETDSQASARDPRLVSLSNPMDASLAAELLSRGEVPDPLRLVEQSYEVMARQFRETQGRDFRLQPFSERVYEWRKSGQADIDTTGFEAEVAALVKARLMIQRTEIVRTQKGKEELTRSFFRHDRIMEFFLLPAFMGANSARQREHDLDEPFWGVYEQLAVRLPDAEEEQLDDFLIERAADTNRKDLLNRYTIARRLRTQAPQGKQEHALQASIA